MVTITDSGKAKCVWCFEEKEGVKADFKDGLKGHLCWPDFRSAVKVRSRNAKKDSRKTQVVEAQPNELREP